MEEYSVTKYFGHFSQIWSVKANSEDEAWNNAEKNGRLLHQTVYKIPFTTKGYVSKVNDNESEPVNEEEYIKWLSKAIELGMIVTQEEYAKAVGLPFCDVWE